MPLETWLLYIEIIANCRTSCKIFFYWTVNVGFRVFGQFLDTLSSVFGHNKTTICFIAHLIIIYQIILTYN